MHTLNIQESHTLFSKHYRNETRCVKQILLLFYSFPLMIDLKYVKRIQVIKQS